MLALLFIFGVLFVAAADVSAVLFRGREPWRRTLAVAVSVPAAATMLATALGASGVFTLLNLALASAAVGIAVILLTLKISRSRVRQVNSGFFRPLPRAIILALLAAVAATWVCHAFCLPSVAIFDDLFYHGPIAAEAALTGRIDFYAAADAQAYWMLNPEMLSACLMLPGRGDALVPIAGLSWALLAAIALYGIVRALGRGQTPGLLAAALFLSSHHVLAAGQTLAAVDLAGAAMALAALAFAMPQADGARLPDAALAGIAAGFAVGCKLIYLPLAPILFVWMLFSFRAARPWRGRLAAGALFAACALAAGGFWPLRNWLSTGNPIFPASIGPWDGPLTNELWSASTPLALLAALPAAENMLYIGKWLVWPLGLGAVSAAGCLLAMAAIFRGPAARRGRPLLLAAFAALVFMVSIIPYAGTLRPGGFEWSFTPYRYALAPFAIGLALFAGSLEGKRWWSVAGFLLALAAAIAAFSNPGWVTGTAIAVAAAVFILVLPGCFPRCLAVAVAVLIVGAALFQLPSLGEQRMTERVFAYDSPESAAWRFVDSLPDGARIAHFRSLSYPLYGRRLQHLPIAVAEDGRLLDPMHVRFDRERFVYLFEKTPPWTPEGLMRNLEDSGADYVFITLRRLPGLDPDAAIAHRAALRSSAHVDVVYDDGISAVFRIRWERSSLIASRPFLIGGTPDYR
jgi:hypothetical protein